MISLTKIFACKACQTVDRVEMEAEETGDILLKCATKKHHSSHPTCDADIFLPETWLVRGILAFVSNPLRKIIGRMKN